MTATAHVAFTDRHAGDLAAHSPGVDARRRAVIDARWTWLEQVHGGDVVVVERPGEGAGARADAAVTAAPGAVLCVQVADCVPVALVAVGAVGVVHVGWRGLVAGVVPAAVKAFVGLGAGPPRAVLGPAIAPTCYEFGAEELKSVVDVVGPAARASTRSGAIALDMAGATRAALSAAGVSGVEGGGPCTACSSDHWSHRGAGDNERQAVVAWLGS